MNDLNGVLYKIFIEGGVLLLATIIPFSITLFRYIKKKYIKKVTFIVELVCLVFSIAYIAFCSYKYFNPSIQYYEGYFLREYRYRGYTHAYVFANDSGRNPVFHLDSFSRKELYSEEFSKGKKYRIYYEEDLKIIVRVEELF